MRTLMTEYVNAFGGISKMGIVYAILLLHESIRIHDFSEGENTSKNKMVPSVIGSVMGFGFLFFALSPLWDITIKGSTPMRNAIKSFSFYCLVLFIMIGPFFLNSLIEKIWGGKSRKNVFDAKHYKLTALIILQISSFFCMIRFLISVSQNCLNGPPLAFLILFASLFVLVTLILKKISPHFLTQA